MNDAIATQTKQDTPMKTKVVILALVYLALAVISHALTFPSGLTNERDGQAINSSTLKAVVLIHGWNGSYYTDEFVDLTVALKAKLNGSEWRLIAYDWDPDSATGDALEPPVPTKGFLNASQAAENAHQHGLHLGQLLADTCPQLEKVHFIAHSAGSWGAYYAALKVLQTTSAKVQITLLDPFMPSPEYSADVPDSPLSVELMSILRVLYPGRIDLLENYYAVDFTDYGVLFAIGATSHEFDWRTTDINEQIDFIDDSGSAIYRAHGGPISFYADTVFHATATQLSGRLQDSGFNLNLIGWRRSMAFRERQALSTISSVTPGTFAGPSQLLTIIGTGFTTSSRLTFNDGVNAPYEDRVPTFISATELRYNVSVGTEAAAWTVRVVNADVESLPYTFYVVAPTAQLTGLSISGPATVNEGQTGQFSATAIYSTGSPQAVSPSWSVTGPASISASGLFTASSVSSNTTATVSASYTQGGITKTASATLTVVNTGSGGGSQISELITNGNFSQTSTGWQRAANFYADNRFTTANSPGGYAYLSNADGTAGNNLYGEIAQYITIPANATQATLSYWYRITTAETGSTAFDTLTLQIVPSVGNVATIDTRSNVNANSSYQQRSFDITQYKGQQILIGFAGQTDGSLPTTFRIDDVSVQAVVPNPVTLNSLAISGPSTVNEQSTAQYTATAIWSDGSSSSVNASWDENSSATTINSSGVLTAGSVSSDRNVEVEASYSSGGVTKTATKGIVVVDAIPSLQFISIEGPSEITEGLTAQYTATAIYSDGSTQPITPTWSESDSAISISSGGLVTAGQVDIDTDVEIEAEWTSPSGTHRTTSKDILVKNVLPPPVLVAVFVDGPGAVNTGSAAQYQATAYYSDGSSQTVTPTWTDDSPLVDVTGTGLLSVPALGADATVHVTATYSAGGITKSGSRTVLLRSLIPPPVITSAGAASGAIGQPFQYLITFNNGPATIAASGMPAGVALDAGASALTGTPTTEGVYRVPFTVTNGGGTANGAVIVTVTQNPATLPYEFKAAGTPAVGLARPMASAPNDGVVTFDGFTGTRLDAQGAVVWTRTYGNNNPDVEISDCKPHPAGGWALSGYFRNTAVFGSQTLVSAGSRDPFIMRIDENGDVLWAQRCGGTKVDYGKGVAVDGAGNCFLLGVFTTSATFGGSVTLTATGTRFDLFIAKYSSAGVFQWARRAGGPEYDDLYCANADAAGNVYIGGIFELNATFGGQTLTVQGNPLAWDGYLAKYDANGNLVWVKQFGEPSGESSTEPIGEIEFDSNGNCYFGGSYDGPLALEGQTLPKQSSTTAMVGKINPAGSLVWIRAIPSTGHFRTTQTSKILPLPDGGLMVGGTHYGKLIFASSILTPENEIGSTEESIFLAKFTSVGTPQWAIAVVAAGWEDFNYLGLISNNRLLFGGDFEATQVSLPGLPIYTNSNGGSILGVLGPQEVAFGLTFDQWLAASFSAAELAQPSITGPLVDFDGDGVNALLEFASGRNARSSSGESPTVTVAGEHIAGPSRYLTLEFIRRTGANPGVSYHVDESSDLVTWTEVDIATHLVGPPVSAGAGFENVVVRSDTDANALGAPPSCFLRLRVVQQ